MPAIPPSGLPPSIPSMPQDDAEADGLYNFLQIFISSPGTAMSVFVTSLDNYVAQKLQEGDPKTAANMKQWIQDCVTNVADPGGPAPSADIYMYFASQGIGFDANNNFSSQALSTVDNLVNAYLQNNFQDNWSFTYPTETVMDNSYMTILRCVDYQNPSTSFASLLRPLLSNFLALGSDSGNVSTIWSDVSQALADPNFFTTYNNPPITLSELQDLQQMLPESSSGARYPLPDFTILYLTIGYSSQSPLQKALLQQMQSSWQTGSMTTLQQWLVNTVTSPTFLTTYPGIQFTDIQQMAAQLSYTLPSYASYYFQVASWTNGLQPTDPDYQFATDFKNLIAGCWKNNGIFQLVVNWGQAVINNAFADYPALDANGANELEQMAGITPPNASLQNALFAMRAQMALLDPTSADYKMLADFQQKWTTASFGGNPLWPNTSGGITDVRSWIIATFGLPPLIMPSAGMQDLFMQYPLADLGTIEWMISTLTGGISSTPIGIDNVYREIYVANGSATSGIYYDFLQKCQAAGSSDANNQIEQWLDDQALDGFSSYPSQQSDVVTLLNNFPFVVTLGGQNVFLFCDYITGYIQNLWMPQFPPGSDKVKFGNTLIAEVVTAETQGNLTSLADLQNYLNKNPYDYLRVWPDIDVFMIQSLFGMFGLQPNPISQVDFILSGVEGSYNKAVKEYGPSSPDATCLNGLLKYILSQPPPDLKDVLSWIRTNILQNPEVWGNLHADVQQLIRTIYNFFPPS